MAGVARELTRREPLVTKNRGTRLHKSHSKIKDSGEHDSGGEEVPRRDAVGIGVQFVTMFAPAVFFQLSVKFYNYKS